MRGTTRRLTSVTHPESGTTSFAYNQDGSLQQKTDAKGQRHVHGYDSDGRLIEVKKYANGNPNSEDGCQKVNYYYGSNPFDGSFSQNITGRLAAVARGCAGSAGGGQFIEMYSYDSAGAVLKKRLRVSRGGSSIIDKDVTYAYGSDGKLSTMQYPGASVPYTYTYDLMDRPTKMTGPSMMAPAVTIDHARNVVYGGAGQVTSIDILKYEADQNNGTWSPVHFTETKTYDELFQLIRIQSMGMDVEYVFSATNNNGRILERWNNITTQKVKYEYDELNRLKRAYTITGAAYDQTHVIDGFGNFYQKNQASGADEPLSVTIDQTKNRISTSGYGYDSNGNMTSRPALGGGSNVFTFDYDNRLLTAAVSSGTEEYNYLADNKRVWKKEPSGTEYVYFYGVGGQKLATYQVATTPTFALNQISVNVYFGGKLIRADGVTVASDRLGSVMGRSGAADSSSVTSHDYFPYGAEIGGATSGNRDKFGTYHRDQSTALDYADQRYYSSTNGRYMTEDPCRLADDRRNPITLNRYTYVWADPVNFNDPTGLYIGAVLETSPEGCGGAGDGGGRGGGGGGGGGVDPGSGSSSLLRPRGRLDTEEKRREFAMDLAAAAAAVLNSPGHQVVVTRLVTTMDCIIPRHFGSGAPARYRHYVAYDGNQSLEGVPGVIIQEQLYGYDGGKPNIGGNNKGKNGVFGDVLAPSRVGGTLSRIDYFQSCFATVIPTIPTVPLFVGVPVPATSGVGVNSLNFLFSISYILDREENTSQTHLKC